MDPFKQINDTYGHPVGDQVLKEFACRSASLEREIDLVGRYGGEELITLLPETDRETACEAGTEDTLRNMSISDLPRDVRKGREAFRNKILFPNLSTNQQRIQLKLCTEAGITSPISITTSSR